MNLYALLRLVGLILLCWLAIKGFVWVVVWSAGRTPRHLRRWNAEDADWLAENRIDLTRVADELGDDFPKESA